MLIGQAPIALFAVKVFFSTCVKVAHEVVDSSVQTEQSHLFRETKRENLLSGFFIMEESRGQILKCNTVPEGLSQD